MNTPRAAALYLGLTLLLLFPLSIQPHRTLLARNPDDELFLWTIQWDVHAFVNQPLSIFDANIFYPQGDTLAYSENLIGTAVMAAPVLWMTHNPILAFNIAIIASCVLCGLGAYVLGRRMGLSEPSALICGMIFAFCPARFFRTPQVHIGTVQWIPFALASLTAYLDGGPRRHLRMAVALFSVQALTSGHGAVFLAVAAFVLVACRVVRGEWRPAWARVRDFGGAGLLLLVPAALVYWPYRVVQHDMGLRRSLDGWSMTPESFLASPTRLHAWLQPLLTGGDLNATASAFLFPGYLPILLGAVTVTWGLVAILRRKATVLMRPGFDYGVLLAVSFSLCLAPPSAFGRLSLWPLVYRLPGFSFIRAPTRFAVLGVLALSALAGIGHELIRARLGPAGRRGLFGAVSVLLVVEFLAIPLPVSSYSLDVPAVDRWMAQHAKPFVVAEVPMYAPDQRLQTAYMLHATSHWQKTVHGYSGILPARHEKLFARLRTFPDEPSLRDLTGIGVTHVIVHADWYRPGDWTRVEERIRGFDAWLRLEYMDPTARVYELHEPQKH